MFGSQEKWNIFRPLEWWTSHSADRMPAAIRLSVESQPPRLLQCFSPISSGIKVYWGSFGAGFVDVFSCYACDQPGSRFQFCHYMFSYASRSGDGIISTYSILDNPGAGAVPPQFSRDMRANTHSLPSLLQRPPCPPPPVRQRGRGRGRSRSSAGRGKLQQQSLLRQPPSVVNSITSSMGAFPSLSPELVRLEKALNLEPYVGYVESLNVNQEMWVTMLMSMLVTSH